MVFLIDIESRVSRNSSGVGSSSFYGLGSTDVADEGLACSSGTGVAPVRSPARTLSRTPVRTGNRAFRRCLGDLPRIARLRLHQSAAPVGFRVASCLMSFAGDRSLSTRFAASSECSAAPLPESHDGSARTVFGVCMCARVSDRQDGCRHHPARTDAREWKKTKISMQQQPDSTSPW